MSMSMMGSVEKDAQFLRDKIEGFPEPRINPAFVVVSGLPGTGKSFFCRKLAERSSFCILESDVLRKTLFNSPDYSPEESSRLFLVCHRLIETLLESGIPVILDATNLSEYNREQLYRIGKKTGAKLILVRIEAPSELVYKRLQNRKMGMDFDNRSDADWNVYIKMKPEMDIIKRNHYIVDTSRDIAPVIAKIIRSINR
jgi:predicted kinase